MGLSWEEAEVAALDIYGWRRSVAHCVPMDVGVNQGQGHGQRLRTYISWISIIVFQEFNTND